MWQLKTVELLNAPEADAVWLPRHLVLQHQQALSVIAAAEQQAAQRLQQAEMQAEHIIEQARSDAERQVADLLANSEADFLQRTEQLFAGWQAQQAEQDSLLVTRAGELLHNVMTRLLDDTGQAQQLNALLRQLVQAQPRGQQATLWSHPSRQTELTQWLDARPHLTWERQFDESLDPDSLLLETASGELRVGWQALKTLLLRAST